MRHLPWPAAAALDGALIVAFAATGRAQHGAGVSQVIETAWPFLAGAAIGWLVVALRRITPLALPAGVIVWLSALILGMGLRRLTGDGTALPFVIVATLVLGVCLVGWRLLAARLRRPR